MRLTILGLVMPCPTHPEHLPWASLQGLDAFAEPAELGFCCIGLVYGVLLTSPSVWWLGGIRLVVYLLAAAVFLVWVP